MMSTLYDEIIYTSINRIAAETIIINDSNDDDNSQCSEWNIVTMVMILVSGILFILLVSLLIYLYLYTDVIRRNRKYVAVDGSGGEPLVTNDMFIN